VVLVDTGKDSDRRCDQVVRTLFKGTILGVDE
jgi:hypothetical protein